MASHYETDRTEAPRADTIFDELPRTDASGQHYILATVDAPGWGACGRGRIECSFRARVINMGTGVLDVEFIPYDGPRQRRWIIVSWLDGSWHDFHTLEHVNVYGNTFTID